MDRHKEVNPIVDTKLDTDLPDNFITRTQYVFHRQQSLNSLTNFQQTQDGHFGHICMANHSIEMITLDIHPISCTSDGEFWKLR